MVNTLEDGLSVYVSRTMRPLVWFLSASRSASRSGFISIGATLGIVQTATICLTIIGNSVDGDEPTPMLMVRSI